MAYIYERGEHEGTPCPYTIKGTVYGGQVPLRGALVKVKGFRGYEQHGWDRTNRAGRFKVEIPGEMSTHPITVTISATGFVPVTVILHPNPDKCKYNLGDIEMTEAVPPEFVFFHFDSYAPV